MNNVLELTKKLVAIPSISSHEKEIMSFVAQWGKKNQLEVITQKKNGIENVALIIGSGKKTTILTTHLDTVSFSLDEWKITSPFVPKVKDNYLYGLGSNDAKGIAASMLQSALNYSKTTNLSNERLVVALVSEEETSGDGTNALVPFLTQKLALDTKKTLVVVGEPTGLSQFSIGSKGNAFIQIHILGKSAHGSRPHEGFNTVNCAAKIISSFKDFEKRLNVNYKSPLGKNTIATTSIESNLTIENSTITPKSPNTIPHETIITVDFRVGPNLYRNNFRKLKEELTLFLKQHKEKGFSFDYSELYPPVGGHAISKTDPFVKLFQKSIESSVGEIPKSISVAGANDAPFWGDAGYNTINEYGPGNPLESHSADEKIAIKELEAASGVYLSIAQSWFNS